MMILDPFRFATGLHRYWGINFLASTSDVVAMAEVEMAATVGGASLCSGGTPSASSTNGGAGAVSTLFDGSNTTRWGAANGTFSEWIMYDFGAPVSIGELRIRARDDIPAQAPRAFTFWGSDDAGVTRHGYHIATGLAAWTASLRRAFTVGTTKLPTGFSNARVWMVDITENNGAIFACVAEMIFANSTGGATICIGGSAGSSTVFNSGYESSRLVDGANTEWAGKNGTQIGKILYTFPSVAQPVELRLQGRASADNSQPKSFTIYWSPDGITFTPTNSYTAQTGWTGSQVRSFNITPP